MEVLIRQANGSDAPQWLDLLKASLGDDYPDKQVYDASWIASQLDPATGHETYVAELAGQLQASISFLQPAPVNMNPIGNLGRCLFHPESFKNGSAESLLLRINELGEERKQLLVSRVLTSDNAQQILFENLGYVCTGFQPFKHMHRVREGALFYVWFARPDMVARLPLSESLSQISELATAVLTGLKIPGLLSVRDGVTGYPLKLDIQMHEATFDDFELWRMQAQTANPPTEVSGGFNLGHGLLRTAADAPLRAILGQRDNNVVAGLAYLFDEHDRCLRITDTFSIDDISIGALFSHVVKIAQEQFSAVYVEVDVLMTAPRLLKAMEQLGFVPVAYLPAFYSKSGSHADVVKLVKLNLVYSLESTTITANARTIVDIVDKNFQDQKIGLAIINLLRSLPIFDGLGDGELRKIARLFTQKLYRPGEKIFSKGDGGNEAYIVLRGQIDICLEDNAKPIASIGNGQIFGELAFLDGASRVAHAVATQASILLIVQRSAFGELAQHEPRLGMVVMRNIAMELSNRLRRANVAHMPGKK